MKLFKENFELINTDEELKKLQEQHKEYDPAYRLNRWALIKEGEG